MQPPRNLPQIPIWKGELGILNIYYSIKFLKIKWIQRSMNPTNAVWTDLILYRLNLRFNFTKD